MQVEWKSDILSKDAGRRLPGLYVIRTLCKERNIQFISYSENIDSSKHPHVSKLH